MFPVWGDVPQRSVNVKVTSPNAAVPTQVPDCRNKACWRVSMTTYSVCPIRMEVLRVRGGPLGSRTSVSWHVLLYDRRPFWQKRSEGQSITFWFHSGSSLQLLIRQTHSCPDPHIRQTDNRLFFNMMLQREGHLCVGASLSFRPVSLCNLVLCGPFFIVFSELARRFHHLQQDEPAGSHTDASHRLIFHRLTLFYRMCRRRAGNVTAGCCTRVLALEEGCSTNVECVACVCFLHDCSVMLLRSLCFPPSYNRESFFPPSRPQFSTSQHHHLRRAQHRNAHRQRIHRHPASAQRTSCCGDRLHQRPAALLHPEPQRSWHTSASLHRCTAIHRWEAPPPSWTVTPARGWRRSSLQGFCLFSTPSLHSVCSNLPGNHADPHQPNAAPSPPGHPAAAAAAARRWGWENIIYLTLHILFTKPFYPSEPWKWPFCWPVHRPKTHFRSFLLLMTLVMCSYGSTDFMWGNIALSR